MRRHYSSERRLYMKDEQFPLYAQSIRRHKGSKVGMRGLERAEGAEESQGPQALGIHRPCLQLHLRSARLGNSPGRSARTLF